MSRGWITDDASMTNMQHYVVVQNSLDVAFKGKHTILACKEKISPNENEISDKGNCSWMEVECLGACVSAPMIQINENYYEDLDEKSTIEILDSLIKDKPLKPGSYRGRKNTAPEKKQRINGSHIQIDIDIVRCIACCIVTTLL